MAHAPVRSLRSWKGGASTTRGFSALALPRDSAPPALTKTDASCWAPEHHFVNHARSEHASREQWSAACAPGAYDVEFDGDIVGSLVVDPGRRDDGRWTAELLGTKTTLPFTTDVHTFATFSDVLTWLGDPAVVQTDEPARVA